MTDVKNIHQRLAAVMGEVSYIQKESKPGMKYTIVSHDKVTALVRPTLLKHGIVYYPTRCEHTHNGNRAECAMTVRFVNVDAPEDFFEVPTFGYGIDPQDKGPGKAMSYAVKYALLKALGLETGDDPDTESVAHTKEDPANPPFDAGAAAERIKNRLRQCKTKQHIEEVWSEEVGTAREVYAADKALGTQVNNLKEQRLKELTDDPAHQAPPLETEGA